MLAFRWAATGLACIAAVVALRAGMIEISDNLDTFVQEMATKGRWVFWGAIANVVAAAFNILVIALERKSGTS